MRFPGLKSRKSSSGAPAQSPSIPASDDNRVNGDKTTSSNSETTTSSLLSLSRWKSNVSNVDEHGVLQPDAAPPPSASTTTTANTGKRSFFGRRKSHSRSLSAGAQTTLDNQDEAEVLAIQPRLAATVSSAGPTGGHPLRQHTLPADFSTGTTPLKSKRPGLSFPKRGLTVADIPSSQHHFDPPRKSTGSLSYHGHDSADSRSFPPSDFNPSSRSDSFQLRSFRSVTSVREEPTLSSLVNEELTNSPLSTRPSSPATAPVSSSNATSYFDSRPNSPGGSARTPTASGASISVSRFREAKAARSSSFNSNASQGTPNGKPSGLKLDLPPPINLEYASRPVLNISQPDENVQDAARPNDSSISALSESLSRASSASPSRESFTTAAHTAYHSPPRLASPLLMHRSTSPSLHSHEDRINSPTIHPLAAHPDSALPLPPIPADPEQQQRQHRRTQSNQSISSLSASLGGWLNTSSFGISFSADDVQKAFAERTAALRSRTPSMKDGMIFGGAPLNRTVSQQQSFTQPEEEVIVYHAAPPGPTREELAILLGGKVLPPPPSETDDDYIHTSNTLPSPKIPLSRASSFSNLGFGTNLFSSTIVKAAKPARDDDEDSEDSRDTSLPKIVTATRPTPKRASRMSNAFHTSDTSSDEASADEEEDSDDSETKARKKEKCLVFPPPRPTNEADRQRLYQAALTPPTLTPQGSSSDLKAYIQPVPPSAPLTSANVNALNMDDDDDENIPLSTLKIRARSEINLSSPHLRPSHSFGTSPTSIGGSAPGMGSSSNFTGQHGREQSRNIQDSLHSVSPVSASMPRSLSAFTTASSEVTPNFLQKQPRSASSHAISTLGSLKARPQSVTLASLIDAEKAKLLPVEAKRRSTTSSRPSESSEGSYPKTPSDTAATRHTKRSSSLFSSGPVYLSPISRRPQAGEGLKPTPDASKATNGNSRNGTVSSATRERHRVEARKSGMLTAGSFDRPSLESASPPAVPSGWSLSPQALQGMPAPPGVDPNLYASLPADQKLNLQMRAQQLMNVMQSMAMQAQNGTLAGLSPCPGINTPSNNMASGISYPQLPVQMQMPMMGSTVSSFPPFPNFFGLPSAFPNMIPSHFNNNLNGMHPKPSRTSPSAIGQPTLLQQAGLSINDGRIASASNTQNSRRMSQ